MTLSHRIADTASLGALLICWAREIAAIPPEASIWTIDTPAGVLEMRAARKLASGMPPIASLGLRNADGIAPIDAARALELLSARLKADWPASGPALAGRIAQSRARIAALVAARLEEPADTPDFLAAEQALIFGHWMHPSPKALGGITEAEERRMTPDWRGAMQLHALSVAEDLLDCGGTQPDLPGFSAPEAGRRILPAHPLTLDRLRRDPAVAALLASGAIRDLGPQGPLWHATSSVRTLWTPDCDWMIKASIPVTVTNSQRVNKRHELAAGALMARHLAGLAGRFGPIRFITDPGWATLRTGRPESGFEVIWRENPYRANRGGKVLQVAGLAAPGLPGRPGLLSRVMAGHDPARWFAAYLDVALDPLMRLYDATGIAFEAHQQNVLLDLTHGLPSRADLRDNQGFYITEDQATPEMRAIPQLVYSRTEAENALGYTLLVNQIFGIVHRMDIDGIWPESAAFAMLAARLGCLADTLPGAGGRLAAMWLRAGTISAKGNLLTQLAGVDELHIPGERAPCTGVANPLPAYAERALDVA